MSRWVRLGLIAFLMIWARALLHAQVVGAIDVGGGAGRASGPWTRESRLAPVARYTSASVLAQGEALAVERTGAFNLQRASFVGAALSPAFSAGLLRLSVSASTATDSATSERWSDATGLIAMSVRLRANGAYMGSAFDRHTPSLVVGVWRSFSSAIVAVSSRSAFATSSFAQVNTFQQLGWDSVFTDTGGYHRYQTTRTVTDTAMVARVLQSRVLEARLDWGVRRWTLHADVLRHAATDSAAARTIARATVTTRLTNGVALFASGGTTAGPFLRAAPVRFGTIGLRLSPAALLGTPLPAPIRPAAGTFAAMPWTDGRYRLVLRVPSARTVELSGDFTHWSAMPMHEIGANMWEVLLPLAAGTYRVNVRVDGDAWAAPAGLPTVDDEFNGRVGIFVVR
ncbi:MAG TPA: glycogen-binding domain-containing protein [Gemmatimonadaceae bacterium]|nr:glycogen-binding domain-containing protein [Gemmatimonadaceae bacterium]